MISQCAGQAWGGVTPDPPHRIDIEITSTYLQAAYVLAGNFNVVTEKEVIGW